MSFYNYAPYVPVAKRRAKAKQKMEGLRKQGMDIQPIEIEGRNITKTFWGDAWCKHLEKFSDYSNRLPRGRTYVRNGSVCHLEINEGEIKAFVSGSSLYELEIKITPLSASRWKKLKKQCEGQIGSLLELLQGKLSKQVMEIVTDQKDGLFPAPKEINLDCDCPDWATMCKHVAAVLYGIGAKLDQQPELLFVLRGVDHNDLISADVQIPKAKSGGKPKRRQLSGDLSDVFGIELDESTPPAKSSKKKRAVAKSKKKVTSSSVKKPKPKVKEVTKPKVKPKEATKLKVKPKEATKLKTIRPTGKTVARMRKRFAMNVSQFARLVGVGASTVSNWESQPERLNLRPESLAALTKVNMLDKTQAWEIES